MNTPEKVTQQWRQLAATSTTDEDGTVHLSIHVMDVNSGHDFVVTITGDKSLNGGYFVGAMYAATELMRGAAGMAPLPTTTLVPRTSKH